MTCTHPNQSSYLQFQNAQKCDDRERKTYEVFWLAPPYCTKMSFGMTHDFQKISVVLRGLQKMKLVASIRGNCKKITSLAASNCTKFDKKEENTSMFRIARVEREIIMKMSMHTRLSDPTQLLKLSRLRLNTIRFRCKGKFKNLKFKKTKFVT